VFRGLQNWRSSQAHVPFCLFAWSVAILVAFVGVSIILWHFGLVSDIPPHLSVLPAKSALRFGKIFPGVVLICVCIAYFY